MRSFAPAIFLLMAAPLFAAGPVLQTGADSVETYDLASREAQYQALLGLRDPEVAYGTHGRVSEVKGYTGLFMRDARKMKPSDVLPLANAKLKAVLLASGQERLILRQSAGDGFGGSYLFFDSLIEGIPVVDGTVNFQIDGEGQVRWITSRFVPATQDLVRTPKLTWQVAQKRLLDDLVSGGIAIAPSIKTLGDAQLAFWTDEGRLKVPRLLWMFDVRFSSPHGDEHLARFGIDAADGELKYATQQLFGLNRTVYSLGYRQDEDIPNWPQELNHLWSEGAPNPQNEPGYAAYTNVPHAAAAWANFAYQNVNIVVDHGSKPRSMGW